MIGATAWQTLVKQAKTPQFYPFVIGFGSVLILSASACRITDDKAYLNSNNPRFAKPFVKRAGLDTKDEGGH